jgi:hypothetical protein
MERVVFGDITLSTVSACDQLFVEKGGTTWRIEVDKGHVDDSICSSTSHPHYLRWQVRKMFLDPRERNEAIIPIRFTFGSSGQLNGVALNWEYYAVSWHRFEGAIVTFGNEWFEYFAPQLDSFF